MRLSCLWFVCLSTGKEEGVRGQPWESRTGAGDWWQIGKKFKHRAAPPPSGEFAEAHLLQKNLLKGWRNLKPYSQGTIILQRNLMSFRNDPPTSVFRVLHSHKINTVCISLKFTVIISRYDVKSLRNINSSSAATSFRSLWAVVRFDTCSFLWQQNTDAKQYNSKWLGLVSSHDLCVWCRK